MGRPAAGDKDHLPAVLLVLTGVTGLIDAASFYPRLGRRVVSVVLMFAGAAIGTLLLQHGLALPLALSGACVLATIAACVATLTPTPSAAGP